MLTIEEAEVLIRQHFVSAGVPIESITPRRYPDEIIFIVSVTPDLIPRAAPVGNELDGLLASGGIRGFVTVRPSVEPVSGAKAVVVRGVHDDRVGEFVRLVTARSRATEGQPSLSYVPDAAHNIGIATQARHHLIFGRRGAGKTSLMVEARRVADAADSKTVWVNMQTHRYEPTGKIFLWIILDVCDAIVVALADRQPVPQIVTDSLDITAICQRLLAEQDPDPSAIRSLIPRIQRLLKRFGRATERSILLFLDDFHYLPRQDQPLLLDMIHACVRDADAWVKVAAIKHLSRWFESPPPRGLQAGQDADVIDLDVSLEDPMRAKDFLEKVLQRYSAHVGIGSLRSVFQANALNRLVLASGSVPRDYLVLSGASIRKALTRGEKARLVGVQDVNNAAGEAGQAKISELEEDIGEAETNPTLEALDIVRRFCLEDQNFTYIRVSFRKKEQLPEEYDLLAKLLDARLLHLISPSVSAAHRAGERHEAFMLDLSQFSGQRFKKYIHVLDFEEGHLVSRETGRTGPARMGDTPRRLVTLLRRAPELDLVELAGLT